VLQRLQNKYIQLMFIMHVGTDVCLCVSLRVGGNQSTLRKPMCPTWSYDAIRYRTSLLINKCSRFIQSGDLL